MWSTTTTVGSDVKNFQRSARSAASKYSTTCQPSRAIPLDDAAIIGIRFGIDEAAHEVEPHAPHARIVQAPPARRR